MWLLLLFGPAWTSPAPAADADLVVFVRQGCPHCADAKVFLQQLARERPDLAIVYRDVVSDPAAATELERLSREAGLWPPGVPTFLAGGSILVGFDDAEHAGRQIVSMLERARPATGPGEVRSRWLGEISVSRFGLPLFTLVLGLLDGFNPCAMWVLLFLLSLLVHLKNRRRMALIAGTFVAVSGAVYYAFMAAWLNLFLVIGLSPGVRWTLAGVALLIGAVNVKDWVAFGRGPSLSIPEAVKPGLYARMRRIINAPTLPLSLLAVAVLALVVNFVELLCTAGLPAVYTAVLTQHEIGTAGRYGYLALYIAGYIADDALMVTLAVLALSQRRLDETAGRWLKLVSGLLMMAQAAILALRPQWLM